MDERNTHQPRLETLEKRLVPAISAVVPVAPAAVAPIAPVVDPLIAQIGDKAEVKLEFPASGGHARLPEVLTGVVPVLFQETQNSPLPLPQTPSPAPADQQVTDELALLLSSEE